MKAQLAIAAAVIVSLLAVGCSSDADGGTATTANATPGPTTNDAPPTSASRQEDRRDEPSDTPTDTVVSLRIGTDDFPGRPAAEQIEQFAQQVANLSEGRISIEPVWQAAGTESYRPDWDQQVARLVISGELDLALVPSRAWDTLGVDTLRPLSAPLLIDSEELLAAVLTSELADQMLADLEPIGVIGLAVFPEGLRHPFAFEQALLGPGDYVDGTIRTPTSDVSAAMFGAWGARVDDRRVDRDHHRGIDSGFVLQPGGVATANVTLYPKANVLVVNAETLSGLSDGDRELLEQAATATLSWAIGSLRGETALAEEFCAAGGVIVHADDADVDALRQAVEPVLEDIRSAATANASILDAIETLRTELPRPVPAPECGEPTVTDSTGEEELLTGVYRMEVTPELMLAAWPNTPQSQLDNNVGVWTISLNAGQHYVHAEDDFDEIVDGGTYRVEGNRVHFVWGDSTTPETLEWERDPEGNLDFTVVNVPDQFRFVYSSTWLFLPELAPWDG